ncbi:MAG: efflux RND transporter permease subunit [Candidatus Sumerlaeaceae bacterium]|nr:efflux RND transporter permease subunit [Candidatus Sumerlaeaceae bacterium]
MQKLAEICIRRPVFASVIILLLVVIGFFGYLNLGVDRFPRVDFPFVIVTTVLPGAAPEEVETEITEKIEEAVNTVSGIDELRSTSAEGVSQVFIQFVLEKPVDVAAQEVRDRINRILPLLPRDAEQPVVQSLDLDSFPVLAVAVSADAPIKEITEYADKVLRRRLESVSGVGQVSVFGGRKRQINVLVDPFKLRAQGLTVNDVERALRVENVQVPGGTLRGGPEELTLRTLGRVRSVEEINKIPVARRADHTITVGEVATVEDGTEETRSFAMYNEEPAVLLIVRKQSGTNTVAVVNSIRERIEDLRPTIPAGYNVRIVQDQSSFVTNAIATVQEHLIVGSILAAVVVFFFLANARTTLIAAVAIPTSIISTFGMIWFMGYTLNVITLLALTLSVGIVVDDAIVVLENIYRYIEEKGYRPFDAAVHATREIGLAVMSITLSLVAVFMPIAFMTGIVGRYMSSFGVTMSFAILVSLLVSFTLTPMLSARFLRASNGGGNGAAGPDQPAAARLPASKARGLYHLIETGYMWLLERALRWRWVVVLVCLGALATVPPLLQAVPKNFLPTDDESQFTIAVRAPEGTSLEATRSILLRIAREVQAMQGVDYTVSTVGSEGEGSVNQGQVYVGLVPVEQRQFSQSQMMAYVRDQILPRYAGEGLRTVVSEPRGGFGADRNADVMFVISGPDIAKLGEYADKMVKELAKVPGAVDVDSSLILGKPQFGVAVDRAKAAELGVSVNDIAQSLRTLVAGTKVSDYNEGGEQYEVHVRADAAVRNDVDALSLVTVPSARLGSVPLGDVVAFEQGAGPSDIRRRDRSRAVVVYADVLPGGSQQAIIDRAREIAAGIQMSPEYTTGLAGRSRELAKSARAFFTVFLMALAFMYLIIAAQFESWIHPVTILLALPLTVPFALVSVLLAGESLNIFSMLGVLVLFAVVKKNSILQIDHTIHLREEGLERTAAVLAANKDRLRPILMTTIAFVGGMLPLFLSQGTGAATNHTISAVVIGGQTLSLLLTLIATPVAYTLFDDAAHSRLWRWLARGLGALVSLPARLWRGRREA